MRKFAIGIIAIILVISVVLIGNAENADDICVIPAHVVSTNAETGEVYAETVTGEVYAFFAIDYQEFAIGMNVTLIMGNAEVVGVRNLEV